MRLFATAASDGSDPMMDNLNDIIHSIVGLFQNFVTMGESWGEPWDFVFPAFLALFFALAFFHGFRHVFFLSAKKTRPVFLFALLVVAVLVFSAIRNDADQNATSNGLAVLGD
jgi:hypothetical protein